MYVCIYRVNPPAAGLPAVLQGTESGRGLLPGTGPALLHRSTGVCCWRMGEAPLCAGAPRGVVPGRGPLVCWYLPRWCAPLRAPRPAVLCPPAVGACCPSPFPRSGFLPRVPVPPPRCCGPERDQIDDRLEATAPCRIHSRGFTLLFSGVCLVRF